MALTWNTSTCVQQGMNVRKCVLCGKEDYEYSGYGDHQWGEWKLENPGTCVQQGMNVRTCSVCGKEDYEYIGYGNHQWGEWKVETPGTCIQQGMNVRKCALCGKEEYVYTGYGDHDWGPWTVVKAPTATEDGLEERVCRTTPNHREQRAIPATGEPAGAGKYVLKGATAHFTGWHIDSIGCNTDLDWSSLSAVWQDAEPVLETDYHFTVMAYFLKALQSDMLTTEPEIGETYYFSVNVLNYVPGDHSLDFSQVDPARMNVSGHPIHASRPRWPVQSGAQ